MSEPVLQGPSSCSPMEKEEHFWCSKPGGTISMLHLSSASEKKPRSRGRKKVRKHRVLNHPESLQLPAFECKTEQPGSNAMGKHPREDNYKEPIASRQWVWFHLSLATRDSLPALIHSHGGWSLLKPKTPCSRPTWVVTITAVHFPREERQSQMFWMQHDRGGKNKKKPNKPTSSQKIWGKKEEEMHLPQGWSILSGQVHSGAPTARVFMLCLSASTPCKVRRSVARTPVPGFSNFRLMMCNRAAGGSEKERQKLRSKVLGRGATCLEEPSTQGHTNSGSTSFHREFPF